MGSYSYLDLLLNLGNSVKRGEITWKTAAERFNEETGLSLNNDSIRKRYNRASTGHSRICAGENIVGNIKEYENYNSNGTVELCKELWFDSSEEKSPDNILLKFGYSPEDWELVSWTFGKWEVALKEGDNKECTTVRAKIRPRDKSEITSADCLSAVKDLFKGVVSPYKAPAHKKIKGLDSNKMLELTGIELHLGKLAFEKDTGADYNHKIAQKRFYKILNEVLIQQEIEKCDTCLICIGNDFFNSDTVNGTTTKGTPQSNDLTWRILFEMGLEMYIKFISTLRDKFNHIEIRLQSGNHDTMSSFYLYTALGCYFKNDKIISFSDNTKDIQVFEWGNNAIFFTHGDNNFKLLVKSVPAEFYETWGRTIYRELHVGHLHCEQVVDDSSGLVVRRVGSPTGTDNWHYSQRFIGATQKYQTFVWHKEYGLLNVKYITFSNCVGSVIGNTLVSKTSI